ncbi:sensor domain-containing diguanylate cyclase [Desulfosporosinus youngiae]|uniref:Diguanylate cyclase (GGDEF) domain-containing protein n=1 Tax=Desulfosporosinus youngiae DSM 17734 TaxID=768710 RepID=H5XUK0_9FIRM|nr:diguanylate cyclase [Desulfosporosinus youngiae]EHQ89018.1 diguanylate cyclase (GGDEF) domain-containing protein [Desulfosporosinus youngiae DSM 17734]
MKKKIAALCAILALIILLPAALFFKTATAVQPPKPSNGVLDLSNWSFEKDGVVSLAGTWSFYFNRFLTHEDFVQGHDLLSTPTPLQIPSTVKSMEGVKPFADNKFYGTLRLVIKLPEGKQTYGLRTDIILTSFKLYIDGNLQGEVGKVGTSGENSLPYYNILTTYFNPESNEVELIYHTADFTAQDCTMVAPKIGLAAQISREGQLGLGRDLFLFGMLLIMAIYHFGLYIMRTKDRAPLFFGVFCLLFALRMLLVGERFLPSHWQLSFFVYGRMAYLSVFIGFSALCGFLHYALAGLLARWFVRISIALGLLSAVFILWVPYSSADRLLMIYAVPAIVLLGYAMMRLVIGTWQGVPFARIVLLGFAVLGATFINDFIYQITLANTPSLIPLGVAVFTFTQAYTLSARFSGAFTRAEQLTVENKAILADLKYMNTKLESLVQERTADLENALKEMEVMSKTDYLTKLPNRRSAFTKIKELIEQKRDFYICLADIDHFKEINDQYGHVKGDEILVLLSGILSTAIGDCGFVGRWGGEEFLIVLETAQLDSIPDKFNEIRRAVEEYRYPDIGKEITMTFGLCQYRENSSLDILIAKSDEALYRGKMAGRNRCIIAV